MGCHSDGSHVRKRPMVHHDDSRQEVEALALHQNRRHPRRLPHARGGRPSWWPSHWDLGGASALRALPPRHQLPWSRLRRVRRRAGPQTARRRAFHHRLERGRDINHLHTDKGGDAT